MQAADSLYPQHSVRAGSDSSAASDAATRSGNTNSPRFRFVDARARAGIFEIEIEANLDGSRRRVSAFMRPGQRPHAVFPHMLNELGESLGVDALDAAVRDFALRLIALWEGAETWRAFKRNPSW